MNNSDRPIAVRCENIHKTFGSGANAFEALRGVTLVIRQGEMRMLMGPSGSGKTTLISIIAGILTQTQGDCFLNGTHLNQLTNSELTHYRGKNIGFVFQAFNLVPMLSIEENVAIPLMINGIALKNAVQGAKQLLDEIGLGSKIGTYPNDLSGGQQQRVAIARALVHDPKLIVCDEPTSHLDLDTGLKIMNLLKEMIHKKGSTLIVVTHDVRITQFADQIDYLEDGKLVNK